MNLSSMISLTSTRIRRRTLLWSSFVYPKLSDKDLRSHMTAFQASSKMRTLDTDMLPYLVERYPLLITKLYIPRLDTKLLTRPHLLELLDRAVHRPLVL